MKILRHSTYISCSYCLKYYHVKCISIVPQEMTNLIDNASEWICESCVSQIFPYNHIEEQHEFIRTISNSNRLSELSDQVFNPFDIHEDFNELCILDDVDPDLNYYNVIQQSISKCKYYNEDAFNVEINKQAIETCFSMFHLNIRSAKKI